VWAVLFYVIEYGVLTLDDIPGWTSPRSP